MTLTWKVRRALSMLGLVLRYRIPPKDVEIYIYHMHLAAQGLHIDHGSSYTLK